MANLEDDLAGCREDNESLVTFSNPNSTSSLKWQETSTYQDKLIFLIMEEWLRLYPEDKRQDVEAYLLATARNLSLILPGYVVLESSDDTTQAVENTYGEEQVLADGEKKALAFEK